MSVSIQVNIPDEAYICWLCNNRGSRIPANNIILECHAWLECHACDCRWLWMKDPSPLFEKANLKAISDSIRHKWNVDLVDFTRPDAPSSPA